MKETGSFPERTKNNNGMNMMFRQQNSEVHIQNTRRRSRSTCPSHTKEWRTLYSNAFYPYYLTAAYTDNKTTAYNFVNGCDYD